MQVPMLSACGIWIGKNNNLTCGMMTCEINNLEIRVKFVFSPDVILCGWLGWKQQLSHFVLFCNRSHFCSVWFKLQTLWFHHCNANINCWVIPPPLPAHTLTILLPAKSTTKCRRFTGLFFFFFSKKAIGSGWPHFRQAGARPERFREWPSVFCDPVPAWECHDSLPAADVGSNLHGLGSTTLDWLRLVRQTKGDFFAETQLTTAQSHERSCYVRFGLCELCEVVIIVFG